MSRRRPAPAPSVTVLLAQSRTQAVKIAADPTAAPQLRACATVAAKGGAS